MHRELTCPECKQGDSLSTTERILGSAQCNEINEDGPDYNGYTDVWYDTSETIGVSCLCGWEYEGPDWMQKLLVKMN